MRLDIRGWRWRLSCRSPDISCRSKDLHSTKLHFLYTSIRKVYWEIFKFYLQIAMLEKLALTQIINSSSGSHTHGLINLKVTGPGVLLNFQQFWGATILQRIQAPFWGGLQLIFSLCAVLISLYSTVVSLKRTHQ